MKTIVFRGLRIRIENPAGSTRSGIDSNGKKWSVVMSYDYGEIIGSTGVDGDPVDCFIGRNKSAKFVYVIHQMQKNGQGFDEDKVFLGFDTSMDAKQAFYKNYDAPDLFIGPIETIPLEVFKKKVMETKTNPTLIHASKINTAIALYADASQDSLTVGDEVTVDGMHGRGVVKSRYGSRVTVQFRNGLILSRDVMFVHNIADRQKQMWKT